MATALEFEDLFSVDDDGGDDEPTTDFFSKFVANAQLAALGIDTSKLERETQSIDQRATGIFRKIAAAASPKTATSSLAKNTPPSATQKIARIEITKYATTGAEVVAEIGEHGEVLRTYAKDTA